MAFEIHLLACGSCLRDLKCLDRAGALLQGYLHSGAAQVDWGKLGLARGPGTERVDARPDSLESATSRAALSSGSLIDLGTKRDALSQNRDLPGGDDPHADRDCR